MPNQVAVERSMCAQSQRVLVLADVLAQELRQLATFGPPRALVAASITRDADTILAHSRGAVADYEGQRP